MQNEHQHSDQDSIDPHKQHKHNTPDAGKQLEDPAHFDGYADVGSHDPSQPNDSAAHHPTHTQVQSASQHMYTAGHAGHTAHASHTPVSSMNSDLPRHHAHTNHSSASGGHDTHTGHAMTDHSGHEDLFRRKFWVSLLLSIPVLFLSDGLRMMLGIQLPTFPGAQWVAASFSLLVFIFGGIPFLQMALPELKNRQPGMMTLISLAITVAFLYSIATLFMPGQMDFFWELVTLIDVMLLGHWIEMRSIRQASGALDALAKLLPDTAERIRPDGSTETIEVSRLAADDLLLIRPGASIPADGVVVEGDSDVNEALLTGESRAVPKTTGSKVIAGATNGDRSLRIRVTATGDQTSLAGIMRLVDEAQRSKSRTQVLADKAAGWLFYIALGAAILTGIIWTAISGFNLSVIERVATVLVIACPHALGLAIPLVVANATKLGAKNGILVRDRLALEKVREVDTILFDKTGTLTKGSLGVVGYQTLPGEEALLSLAIAAAVEGDSEHPISKAFQAAITDKNLTQPKTTNFQAIKGRGVSADTESNRYWVGGPRLLEMLELQLPQELKTFEQEASADGQSVVHLVQAALDGTHPSVQASFALSDVIRPESRKAIEELQARGIKVAIVTGDSEAVARSVAQKLGVETVFAQVLPENKDAMVAELQKKGEMIAMVGDGINDAPALTRADIGIAIGAGTDVAIESSGIILVKSDPMDVVKLLRLSELNYRKMIQNLIWAAGYNLLAIPLAAGVLAPFNIVLSPAVGALLMSLSTIIVAINSQLMNRVEL